MGKFILIWMVLSDDGHATASAEFSSLLACDAAKQKLEQTQPNRYGKTVAYCFEKDGL